MISVKMQDTNQYTEICSISIQDVYTAYNVMYFLQEKENYREIYLSIFVILKGFEKLEV